MTAPTIALTVLEAKAIAGANAALSWVDAETFPWAFAQSGLIKARADDLRDSLDDYAGLTADRAHPAALFPDLEDGRDNAMETALEWVTEDIRAWTGAVEVLANEAEDAARVNEKGVAA